MPSFLAFCEADADFQTTKGLTDRVLRERGPQWVREHPVEDVNQLRAWQTVQGRSFIAWSSIGGLLRDLRVVAPRGHFGGEKGRADALAGRNALAIVRQMSNSNPIDAVFLVRDADNQPERRGGLDQARHEFESLEAAVAVVIGVADPEREAWIISGFDPRNDREREALERATRELGGDPREHPDRMRHGKDNDARSAKRILNLLADSDSGRMGECLERTELDRLHSRGAGSGLKEFLDEIEARVTPLFG